MRKLFTLSFSFLILTACAATNEEKNSEQKLIVAPATEITSKADTAYFAGGCFWCVEASFDQIEGVIEAVSGYSGGKEKNTSYKAVSYGKTGHAEAVMVIYNPEVISFSVLLDILFTAHDPTQLNRQGPDVGKQYRSAVFYVSDEQKNETDAKIKAISTNYANPIVTEVKVFSFFEIAEEYHQDFERKNPNQPYVVNVSKPKIEKVAEKFKTRLKKSE
ncbi:MAG: peptide-methionine (S)-S-oxide reductase [Marivirga sp.]|jgi:peptide-methionine (S)-S-oxide reductase